MQPRNWPWTSMTAMVPLRATRDSEWSTSLTGVGTGWFMVPTPVLPGGTVQVWT